MKLKPTFIFLFLTQILTAQNFTEAPQNPPLDGVWQSSTAFSDVDGDGDEDVLLAGSNGSLERIAKLYLNDGSGNFSLFDSTSFTGVLAGSVAFSDIDNDGDQDVFIAGSSSQSGQTATLYTNDGTGNFSRMQGTLFDGVGVSSIAFEDIDNDGDPDLLITGQNNSFERIAKLYTNDGTGNFSLVSGTPFEGVQNGSVAFSDVDGDDDSDVLITGKNNSDIYVSNLFINDGSGNFSIKDGTPFDSLWQGSVVFADTDGDGDEDVLLTGQNNSERQVSLLYLNDGLGDFTKKSATPFQGVWGSSVAFADIDNDMDLDVMITGQERFGDRFTSLYTNDGAGNFMLVDDTPFEGGVRGSVDFSDVDGDGDQDVLLTGSNNSNEQFAKLYLNSGISPVKDLSHRFGLELTAFPNPSSNRINLNCYLPESGFSTLRIFDLTGNLVSQQNKFSVKGTGQFKMDVDALRPGNYFIELSIGGKTGIAKFLVK